MDNFKPRPEFRIDDSASAEAEFALHELEQSINTDPHLLNEALQIATAFQLPANSDASLVQMAEQTKATSPLWDLNAVISMWQDYEQNQTWKYLDFDDDSNEDISQNIVILALVEQLHHGHNHDATRYKIRTTRMALFIGRVLAHDTDYELK